MPQGADHILFHHVFRQAQAFGDFLLGQALDCQMKILRQLSGNSARARSMESASWIACMKCSGSPLWGELGQQPPGPSPPAGPRGDRRQRRYCALFDADRREVAQPWWRWIQAPVQKCRGPGLRPADGFSGGASRSRSTLRSARKSLFCGAAEESSRKHWGGGCE